MGQIILFVKIVKKYFERKAGPVPQFLWEFCETPDLALAGRTCLVKIQNGHHKTRNTRDKVSFILYFLLVICDLTQENVH